MYCFTNDLISGVCVGGEVSSLISKTAKLPNQVISVSYVIRVNLLFVGAYWEVNTEMGK